MSTDPSAKLFYGFTQPVDEYGEPIENEEDKDEDGEGPWERAVGTNSECVTGFSGYDDNLINFLAVEESLHVVEWSEICVLEQTDLEVKPDWDKKLRQASEHFKLDIPADQQPKWHLVCLYF